MPRNFNKYQYETSPRKLEPEYTPRKNPYKSKKSTARTNKKIVKNSKQIKNNQKRIIKYVAIGFLIVFGICYRNSQIDESFAKMQNLKKEVAEVQKQNVQLEISIENGLNLNNLEQEAKQKLGMQKLNSKQTKYIVLPKVDYVEAKSEGVIIDDNIGGLKGIINKIGNIFK